MPGTPAEAIQDPLATAAAVAGAALSTPGVYSLSPGFYAEAATYGAGEKVLGVVVGDAEIVVRIVALYPPADGSLHRLAERVRVSTEARSGGLPVSVSVDDVEVQR